MKHLYVNSNRADDTGDGLTWWTAKKTLNAGWGLIPADITADDAYTIHVGGTNADTTQVSGNKTTDATHYIVVTCDLDRHPGYWSTLHWRLSLGSTNFTTTTSYLRIYGGQFEINGVGNNATCLWMGASGTRDIRIAGNLFRYTGSGTSPVGVYCGGATASNIYIYNNVFEGFNNAGTTGTAISAGTNGMTARITNNTFVNNRVCISIGTSGTWRAYNNLFSGSVTQDCAGTASASSGYNLTTRADFGISLGSNNLTSQTVDFVSTSDFHLANGTQAAHDAALDDPYADGMFSDDLDQSLRGTGWDIGAHQYGALPPPKIGNAVADYDSSANFSVTLPKTATVGSILVAVVTGGSSFNPTSASTYITDDGSNTWTRQEAAAATAAGTEYTSNNDASIWTAPVSTEVTQVTLTVNASLYGWLCVFEISGANLSVTNAAHAHSLSATSLTVDLATTTDPCTITIAGLRTTTNPADQASWLEAGAYSASCGYVSVIWQQATTTGSYDPAWTFASSAAAAAGICIKTTAGAAAQNATNATIASGTSYGAPTVALAAGAQSVTNATRGTTLAMYAPTVTPPTPPPAPRTPAVTCTIGGVTKSLQFASFSIEHQLGARDTARIRLLNERPTVRSTINITVDGVLRFGGIILAATESGPITRSGVTSYYCDVDAVGWDIYLDTVLYTADRPQETLQARLTNMLSLVSAAPYSLTLDCATPPTVAAQKYARRSLADISRELCSQATWTYRITPGKAWTWRPASGAPSCPFNVNLSGGAKPVGDVKVKTDASNYANKVWVIAGDAGSEIVVEAHDDTEIASYGLCEITVAAPNIKDTGAAQALADGTLAWRKQRPQALQVSVETAGAWPGMATTVTLPARNINASFLIQGVSVTALTPFDVVYTLSCSSFSSAQASYLDTFRAWSGGATQVLSSVVGSGGGGGVAIYGLGGDDISGVVSAAYVAVRNPTVCRIDGDAFVNRVANAIVRTRSTAGSVTPRIVRGASTVVATGSAQTSTGWTTQIISLGALAAGANEYRLEILPSDGTAVAYAQGYIEIF